MASFLLTESIKNWHIARLYFRHIAARTRRARRTLPIEDYLATIDQSEVERIAWKYYSEVKRSGYTAGNADSIRIDKSTIEGFKYINNVPKNLKTGAGHVIDLDLDIALPQRILDLGCGAGYFLYVSQLLGHDCLGLDAPFVPAYKAMTDLLGVARVTATIQPFKTLPDLGEPFDLITAFRVCFDTREDQVWGTAEWDFFCKDISKHLKPNGLLQVRLNRRDGKCYTPELLSFFLSRGAEVYRSTIRLRRECLL